MTQDNEQQAGEATDPAELERQIMSPMVSKNEREHWAAREIERLRSSQQAAPEIAEAFAQIADTYGAGTPSFYGRRAAEMIAHHIRQKAHALSQQTNQPAADVVEALNYHYEQAATYMALQTNLPEKQWQSLIWHVEKLREHALASHPTLSQQTNQPPADAVERVLECTSTHCERRQECASPRECTGDGKRLDPVIAAMTWMTECHNWLLSKDLDMEWPQADPTEIVDRLAALRPTDNVKSDDIVIGDFIARYEEAAGGALLDADTAELLAREFKRMRAAEASIIGMERAAKVCDRIAEVQRSAGAEGSFEYADIADHIGKRIRQENASPGFMLHDAPQPSADAVARVAKIIDPDAFHETLPIDGCGAAWSVRRAKAREKALQIIAALSATHQGEAVREAAWLIELGSSEPCAPRYWGGVHGWTSDHMKAVRYCREADAQSAAESIGEAAFHDSYRLAEHIWDDGRTAAIRKEPESSEGGAVRDATIKLGDDLWNRIVEAAGDEFVGVPVALFAKGAADWRFLLGVMDRTEYVAERAQSLCDIFDPPSNAIDTANKLANQGNKA